MEKQTKAQVNGGYPLHTFEEVESIYLQYISSVEDRKQIRDAYAFICEKHDGQLRKSGEPYIHHLIEVAYIIASLHAGPKTIIAGLLHDVVEDTDVTIDEIVKRWGDEVGLLVDSLTKIQWLKLSKFTAAEFEAEDHRKIFLGMAKDIRVIIIKLADRLHNMRTLAALSPERQKALSKETLEVFVPIASRLGLDSIKTELEDLCLKYGEPDKYEEITKLYKRKVKIMTKSLDSLKKKIGDILFEHNIPFEISSRVKSLYSTYKKVYIKGRPFEEVYDILALRVITETEIQCYEALGLIHQVYTPVPGRFKDYIAMPKPNMYRSLHTTIIGGDGNFYEVQIRTKEMDEVAETGIAAHWAYKEGGYNSEVEQREIENKLHWFRDFVSISSESQDENATEYMDNLNRDIFGSRIYVFTPKGKVIELPSGSTPVDFAYHIHSKVGDLCVGSLVNGVMVPLNTILKTGDMVEIKTSKTSPGPSERWLDFVKSGAAKQCIRKFIAKKNAELLRDEKIARGKSSCIDAFRDRGLTEEEMMQLLDNEKLLENYGFKDVDELFIGVNNRKPIPSSIIDFLKIKRQVSIEETINRTTKQINKDDDCPVYCKGVGKIAISLANCCTPIPGDDIIGYITKGKGISVHRVTCPNIAHEKERLVDVYWKQDLGLKTYPVDIMIEASDRTNLLVDVMNVLTSSKVSIASINAKTIPQNFSAIITATILVTDAKRLNDIFNILHGVTGVYEITRVIH